jgi:hypothetical protein
MSYQEGTAFAQFRGPAVVNAGVRSTGEKQS